MVWQGLFQSPVKCQFRQNGGFLVNSRGQFCAVAFNCELINRYFAAKLCFFLFFFLPRYLLNRFNASAFSDIALEITQIFVLSLPFCEIKYHMTWSRLIESFSNTQFSLKPFHFFTRPINLTVKLNFFLVDKKVWSRNFFKSISKSFRFYIFHFEGIARSFENQLFYRTGNFPKERRRFSGKEKVDAFAPAITTRKRRSGREGKKNRRGKNRLTFFLAPDVVHVASFKTDGVSPKNL